MWQGKRGNIAIVTFSMNDSSEKVIIGINKANKYIAKKYEYETNSEEFLIQEANQEKQRTELQNQRLHPVECYACGQVAILSRTATKNTTYMYRIEKRKL